MATAEPDGVTRGRVAILADDDEFFRLAMTSLLTRQLGFARVIETASLDEAIAALSGTPETALALFDLQCWNSSWPADPTRRSPGASISVRAP